MVVAAFALLIQTFKLKSNYSLEKYPKIVVYVLGGIIGLLSGLVGIGGGIFLAPILNQLKWDKPLVIASLASFFILVNSISGIGGLLLSNTFKLAWPETIALLLAVFIGGQIGTRLSLKRLSAKRIRILTAFLVLFVGIRVLLTNGFQISFFS